MATSSELAIVFTLMDELIALKQFAGIDRILVNTDPKNVDPVFSVGILRNSSMYKKFLPNWQSFLQRTSVDLQARGKDPATILRGLL